MIGASNIIPPTTKDNYSYYNSCAMLEKSPFFVQKKWLPVQQIDCGDGSGTLMERLSSFGM